ncbi:MAG: hypothetical protein L0229_21065 [Blastocatellia bacterium]|nr:hypothetical protein [Blastocatellia bacterium]
MSKWLAKDYYQKISRCATIMKQVPEPGQTGDRSGFDESVKRAHQQSRTLKVTRFSGSDFFAARIEEKSLPLETATFFERPPLTD